MRSDYRKMRVETMLCSGNIVALAMSIVLAGCASDTFHGSSAARSNLVAWDGLGRDPNRPKKAMLRQALSRPLIDLNAEREKTLTTLRPYSEAWWAVHDEIEAELDRQLAQKLIICRSCLPDGSNETTGSVPAKEGHR